MLTELFKTSVCFERDFLDSLKIVCLELPFQSKTYIQGSNVSKIGGNGGIVLVNCSLVLDKKEIYFDVNKLLYFLI